MKKTKKAIPKVDKVDVSIIPNTEENAEADKAEKKMKKTKKAIPKVDKLEVSIFQNHASSFCSTFPKVDKVEVSIIQNPEESFCSTFPKVDECIKITYEGKEYIKSIETNIVFNMDEEELGKYNETTKKIDFNEKEYVEEEYEK